MITLSKIFSRERSHFYMRVWNDSDRLGLAEWIGYNVQNNLFLRENQTNKMSVWYSDAEMDQILQRIENKFITDATLFNRMKIVYDEQLASIMPILNDHSKLNNISDLTQYFKCVVRWWSTMAIFFFVPELPRVAKSLQDATLSLRLKVEKFSPSIDKIMVSFWQNGFPQYADLSYILSPEEAVSLGSNKMSPQQIDRIKQRLNGFGLLNNQIFLLPALRKELEKKHLNLQTEAVQKNLEIIHGVPACEGVAKGPVKLLLLKDKVSAFEKGAVLVTEMTDPDFVPAMKKAAAIVTDEGGITCHAAIMARELNKPCVIGTKIATKVLKDGDLVEVNAKEGIVRKLQ